MLPQAEVYVYEKDTKIQGFVGLNDEYIEGFEIRGEGLDEDNGEKDYEMIWRRIPEE